MSLFDRLTGQAGKVDNQQAEKMVERLLVSNEEIVSTYKLVRDLVIFTNKRLILVDIQGATGTKKQIQNIPYKSISHFVIETAGVNDLDSEIELYISSASEPVVKLEMGRNKDHVYNIGKLLAEEILN
ncbi:PH domain-containing protein [Fundicoccus culcitae]|uniref:PH domain-containing protein n=1 Tax=Fundicoccus culcitae TaxID=2969821 RepID=A0ABY5P7H8_9LACT|nr:PH domain-containing protein [Fundicoccus culcitae]UUX34499.1 PH domain-containing protein [Fundicoccus culcitae]